MKFTGTENRMVGPSYQRVVGEGSGELVFNGYRAEEEEKALDLDGGDGCPKM